MEKQPNFRMCFVYGIDKRIADRLAYLAGVAEH